jgi:hypothetical protein
MLISLCFEASFNQQLCDIDAFGESHIVTLLRTLYLLKDNFLRRWVKRYARWDHFGLVWCDSPRYKKSNQTECIILWGSDSENLIRHDDEEINAFFNITQD